MWKRCNNPENKNYPNYKDCKIDERYRYFSNYINDIKQLENFDKLCKEPSKWDVDKDKIDSNNRHYYFEHLSIVSENENNDERHQRKPIPKKPIKGISLHDGTVITFNSINDAKENGFDAGHISKCCRGKLKSHKGYKWEYINKEEF